MIFKVLADAFLVVLSFILAYFIRFKVLVFITPSSMPIFEKYSSILIFVTLLWLAVFGPLAILLISYFLGYLTVI